MITAAQLVTAYDKFRLTPAQAQPWVEPMNGAMARFGIATPQRQAAFLGQVGWESAGLTQLAENLNYSAELLLQIFPKYFTADEARTFARKPVAIANRVYSSRYGNGNEASGDGWKYRGRGLIQVTFRGNYRACGTGLGVELESNPDALLIPHHAAFSAAWYFQSHGCNQLADAGDIVGITRKINGGSNGLEQRTALYRHILPILANQERSNQP